jgi:amidophosphoribosyltransferase
MSELLKHECGIALIRLLKPLEYFQAKYGTWLYGFNKLYLLMEKQHNRGQDGAGLACLKLNMEPGNKYIQRFRSTKPEPIRDIFKEANKEIKKRKNKHPDRMRDPLWAKEHIAVAGEIYLGHLRYGTYGKNKLENVHPVLRQNNWESRNLLLAGNFNLTNVKDQFNSLIELGQHPKDFNDTVTMLENVGHFLDEENQRQFEKFKAMGYSKKEISPLIARDLEIGKILTSSSKKWDGGYVITGIIGHGDCFVLRDPSGIRPAYYYHDDEIAVVTSERPVIQTVLNVNYRDVKEVSPGYAVIIKKNGEISERKIHEPLERKACSFERIYFSRGGDRDIYKERKKLGKLLVTEILKSIDYDLENTVFSFIPNTAEVAFYGMVKGIEDYLNDLKVKKILEIGSNSTPENIKKIISLRPRVEKVAIKDVKLRTFISQEEGRTDLVGHVYDVSYGVVRNDVDTLVIIDDSIVRGTTLKESILKILDRLKPKKIIILSSSPQIRYPDCYGIDMARLEKLIAFKAAIELLKDIKQESIISDVYRLCKAQENIPKEKIVNHVKKIYEPFTDADISAKITQLLKPSSVKAEIEIVYQSIENLHLACPDNLGDWYFTGDYPTPGGNKVVNKSFINYIEKRHERAY